MRGIAMFIAYTLAVLIGITIAFFIANILIP